MWIFKTFLTSVTEPKKYKTLLKQPTKKILGYFVFWMAILGLALGLYTQFSELPKLRVELEQNKQLLVNSYPEDLVINWDKEKLTTAPAEFQEIKFENDFSDLGDRDYSDDQDTKFIFEYKNIELDPESLEPTNALRVIVDQTQLYIPSSEGWASIELRSLPYFSNAFEISDENIGLIADKIHLEALESIDKVTPFIYIFFVIFMIISRIVASLFYSLMIFFFSKLVKFPKNWKQSWNLSMIVMVLAEMINQIANLSYKTLDIPMFTLSFWLITSYVLFVNLKKPSVKAR